MPRHRNPEPEQIADTATPGRLVQAASALSEQAQRSMVVANQFGDGVAYERERVVSQARFFMGQSAEAMLELGKRLILIKENEPHGEFVEIVEERLQMHRRTAQRFMAAAVKFSKATALSLLGKTKLFALMDESDEALEALAEGGTVAGLSLDKYMSMSSREMCETLRAKDKVILKKDQKLNALAEAEELRRNGSMAEREQQQLDDLRTASLACEGALLALVAQVDAITNAPATEATELCARQSLDYVVQRLVDACASRGIAVDVMGEHVEPGWQRQIAEMVERNAQTKPARGKRQ